MFDYLVINKSTGHIKKLTLWWRLTITQRIKDVFLIHLEMDMSSWTGSWQFTQSLLRNFTQEKISLIHPQETIKVCRKFNGNPSDNSRIFSTCPQGNDILMSREIHNIMFLVTEEKSVFLVIPDFLDTLVGWWFKSSYWGREKSECL